MALTGYTKTCGRSNGGIKRVGLIEAADLSKVTETEGKITAITFAEGKKFHKYEFQQDQAEITVDGENVFNYSLNMWFNKMSAETSKAMAEIADAAPCGIVALVEQANGSSFLLGYNSEFGTERAVESFTAGGGTGRALTDANNYQITLATTQAVPVTYLDDSLDTTTLYAEDAA